MANETQKLTIEVEAKVDEAISKMRTLTAAIKELQATTGQDTLVTFSARVRQSGQAATGAAKAVDELADKQAQLARANKASAYTLLQVQRIAADAPFGILGIANNIDGLVQSWGNLKSTLPAGQSAFAALARSLVGPMGIALAVSTVTSLLIWKGKEIKNLIFGVKELTEAEKKFREAMDTAAGGAYATVAQVQSLIRVYNEETTANKDRVFILKELNGMLDKYGVELNDLSIKSGTAAASVRALTDAMVAQAASKVLADEIGRVVVAEAKAKQSAEESGKAFLEKGQKIDSAAAALARYRTAAIQAGKTDADLVDDERYIKLGTDLMKLRDAAIESKKAFNEFGKEMTTASAERAKLEKLLDDANMRARSIIGRGGKEKTKEDSKAVFDFIKYVEQLKQAIAEIPQFNADWEKTTRDVADELIKVNALLRNKKITTEQYAQVLDLLNQRLEVAKQSFLALTKIKLNFPDVGVQMGSKKDLEAQLKQLKENYDATINPIDREGTASAIDDIEKRLKKLYGDLPTLDEMEKMNGIDPNRKLPGEDMLKSVQELRLALNDIGITKGLDELYAKLIKLGKSPEDVKLMIENIGIASQNAQAAMSLFAPLVEQTFNALANGTSVVDALAQGFKRMFTQLALAVAQAIILAALINSIPGLKEALEISGTTMEIFQQLLGFTKFKKKGSRAGGGFVAAGQPYLVGEVGAEVFVPQTSGSIVPNSTLRSGGGQRVVGQISGYQLLLLMERAQKQRGRLG